MHLTFIICPYRPRTGYFNIQVKIMYYVPCASSVNGVILREPLQLHWMNNKELLYDIGVEKLLSEALCLETDNFGRGSMGLRSSGSPAREGSPSSLDLHIEEVKPNDSNAGSVCSGTPSSKNASHIKLKILLGRWIRSTDILFAVHPVDGSFLTWTIEWLDDVNRQTVVSFTSRLPAAFPVIDASSIRPTVQTFIPRKYKCDVLRRKEDKEKGGRTSNEVCLLTNHENGSLNLWHMTMDGNTDFAKVRYITHKLRMCGHRFCVTQIVAHPLLPLVLTVSQSRCSRVDDIARKSLSEVILWRTCSVGPLCKSGGMTELARIVSPIHFGCVRTAWIPAHLPRCCFIVSDGQNLVIYQTNVRAHDLVEMDDSTKQLGSPIERYAPPPPPSAPHKPPPATQSTPSGPSSSGVPGPSSSGVPGPSSSGVPGPSSSGEGESMQRFMKIMKEFFMNDGKENKQEENNKEHSPEPFTVD
ncbi:unnamed protein product [Cylicocyclus nassatus]|uniref:Uncharacterized protein n=1 Tax=Cylicocyclus nassatus TaxID=53992 RepID=A0AA36H1D2_CYLNA|nr:unnamed protein product [Cylicocyclus nassatus]